MISRLRALSKDYELVLLATAVLTIPLLWSIASALLAEGVPPGFADKDFANYWMAGQLALLGQSADLFGPQPVYFAHLTAAFGEAYPWHNWSYPPHVLLLLWPLGFLGYKAAFLAFMGATGIFFCWALKEFAGRRNPTAWIAAAPFIVHNLQFAQNGFLCAGLGLGALALREKRPVLAGILLGLLTIKPQLGLLFPFLLLAERRWTAVASAAATALALAGASAAIFGIDAWRGYVAEVLPYQAMVMRELEGTFLAMMPSVYGMLRNWGVASDLALPLHLVVALPVAAIAILSFFKVEEPRDRAILLLIATFLVTPYALSYDLGLFVAGIGLLAGRAREPVARGRVMLFSIAMLLPVLMVPLGEMKVPIAPFVIMAVFVVALRQSGLFANVCGQRKADVSPAS